MPIIPEVCQLRMPIKESEGEIWDDGATWQKVYLSSVCNPNLLYLQLVDTQRMYVIVLFSSNS